MTDSPHREPLAETMSLLSDLMDAGVRFTHWKSNWRLAQALAGAQDLDLLVHREDAGTLRRVLAEHDFKPVTNTRTGTYPTIRQYLGLDPATHRWIHLDVYFSVTTGTSLVKDYRLPIDRMLRHGDCRLMGVPVPEPGAELVALVLSQSIKRSSLLQLATKADARSTGQAAAEIDALLERDPAAVERAQELLAEHLPELDRELWLACLESLREPSSMLRRFLLGTRLRGRLSGHRRVGRLPAAARRLYALAAGAVSKAKRRGGAKRLDTGGAIVALVGPEATGKSTLTAALASWLREHYEVSHVHFGKPPPTFPTAPLSVTLPLMRRLVPGARTSVAPTKTSDADRSSRQRQQSPLFIVRSLMLAWERRTLARRMHRRAANGGLVICDRYPSARVGAMDSARLERGVGEHDLRRRAVAWEQSMYRSIPPATLVVRLTVPVEVAIQRNRDRSKAGKESDRYVAYRHTHQAAPDFPGVPTLELDTGADRDEVLGKLREMVWRRL